ncbi:C40 family peptidase [Aurantimonas sp. A2-1-M11]|uniref:C40 family peptidase n=1 Tax=Aurantimonas sp. A2-1-M11 TaxID=3113712 RepID=UPI002F94555D
MTESLDPRLNAMRPDLADRRLEGQVTADRFVEGALRRIIAPLAPVRRHPAGNAPLDTEALFGEIVTVFDEDQEGWAWVQLQHDAYVGYVPSAALGAPGASPTHRVSVPRTLVFPGYDIKLPPLHDLPMGARVAVVGAGEDHNASYARIEPAGAVVTQHIEPAGNVAGDYVAIAEQFLGVPYLWGGKSASGIDCSGLVQIACQMAGIDAPRDTDMHERGLGTRIAGVEALQRGDLVFWKGHVGIMLDGTRLLHANAHHMMTAVEPLAAMIERLDNKGAPVTSVRRVRAAGTPR